MYRSNICYLALNKPEEALKDAELSIETAPPLSVYPWPKGYLRKADALAKLGRK